MCTTYCLYSLVLYATSHSLVCLSMSLLQILFDLCTLSCGFQSTRQVLPNVSICFRACLLYNHIHSVNLICPFTMVLILLFCHLKALNSHIIMYNAGRCRKSYFSNHHLLQPLINCYATLPTHAAFSFSHTSSLTP